MSRSNSWPEWMGVGQGQDLEMFFWNFQGMREGMGVQKTYHSLISDFIFGVFVMFIFLRIRELCRQKINKEIKSK